METVDAELDRLVSKRASQDRSLDPDEREALWQESVRRYNARRREEMRAAWTAFHEGQAERHRRTLEDLITRHETAATQLQEAGANDA